VLDLLSALRVLQGLVTDLRWQVGYWQGMHRCAREREDELKDQIQLLQGEIRELKRRLFGRKSETAAATQPTSPVTPPPKMRRRRGQQPGSKGHGRRNHDHLPATLEPRTLPADQARCSCRGEPYQENRPNPTCDCRNARCSRVCSSTGKA
jgi:transposase